MDKSEVNGFTPLKSSPDGQQAADFYEKVVSLPPTKRKSANFRPTTFKRSHQESVKFNKTHFFRACLEDNVEVLKTINFVQNDINSIDAYGWTGLMIAACEGSARAFRFLLDQQADLTIVDGKGRSAKRLAELKGKMEILEIVNSRSRPVRAERVETKLEPFFCKECGQEFRESTRKQHESSTLHRFNRRNGHKFVRRYFIPESNVGFQMMMKQGWDRECGLGPSGEGLLYPMKTTLRQQRSGLGVKQDEPARITHFAAFDRDAVKWRRPAPKPKTRHDFVRDQRRNRQKDIALRHELS